MTAADKMAEALHELHAMVWGECPSLLNEDSGGNARLDYDCEQALAEYEREKAGQATPPPNVYTVQSGCNWPRCMSNTGKKCNGPCGAHP